MLNDPSRCVLLPVALAEELPARETAALVERITKDVKVCVEMVIVNDVLPFPFPAGLEDLDAVLARLADAPIADGLRTSALAQCAAFMRSRSELNCRYLAEIERATRLPIVRLPHLPDGVRGVADLETLRDALCAASAGPM